MAVYLNERVKFKCKIGRDVTFKPVRCDHHLKIRGFPILTTGSDLILDVTLKPDQCPNCPNPSTGVPPGPCLCPYISGGWSNKDSNLKLPSGNALLSTCEQFCRFGGVLKPTADTFQWLGEINTNAIISGTSDKGNFKSTGPENNESVLKKDSVGSSNSSKVDGQAQVKNNQNANAVVSGDEKKEEQNNNFCAKCGTRKECEGCAFLETSDVKQEKDGTAILKKNSSKNKKIDAYISSSFYTTDAVHHVIPVNQGFNYRHIKDREEDKKYKEIQNSILCRVANFFDYDINSSGNLVRLPTFDTSKSKDLSYENKVDIAVDIMNKTNAQFHFGHHYYTFTEVIKNLESALKKLESGKKNMDIAVSQLENATTFEEKKTSKDYVMEQLEITRTVLGNFKSFVYLTELIDFTCKSLEDNNYRLDQIKGLVNQIKELRKPMETARNLLNTVKPYRYKINFLVQRELDFLIFNDDPREEKVKCCVLQKKNDNKNFFQQIMDGMADEIRPNLINISRKFNRENAGKYYFVSKLAFYYAYRDVLEKFKLDLELGKDDEPVGNY